MTGRPWVPSSTSHSTRSPEALSVIVKVLRSAMSLSRDAGSACARGARIADGLVPFRSSWLRMRPQRAPAFGGDAAPGRIRGHGGGGRPGSRNARDAKSRAAAHDLTGPRAFVPIAELLRYTVQPLESSRPLESLLSRCSTPGSRSGDAPATGGRRRDFPRRPPLTPRRRRLRHDGPLPPPDRKRRVPRRALPRLAPGPGIGRSPVEHVLLRHRQRRPGRAPRVPRHGRGRGRGTSPNSRRSR